MLKPSKPTLSSGLHIEIHLPPMGHAIPMAHPIGSLSSAGNSGKLSRMLSVADKLKSAIADEKLKSSKMKEVKIKAKNKGKMKNASTKDSENSDNQSSDQGNDQESNDSSQ